MEAMVLLVIVFSGLLGLIVGSFINVLTLRYKTDSGQNLMRAVSGRSHCSHCQKQLAWFELVPVISFLALRGRCLKCKTKISWQYPIVELLTGAVFAGVASKILSLEFFEYYFYSFPALRLMICAVILFWLFFSAILISLSIIDLKHYLLPDKILFPGILAAILLDIGFWLSGYFSKTDFFLSKGLNFLGPIGNMLSFSGMVLADYALGAIVFGGFLFLIYALSRGRAMGFGDVKLGVFLGLILGFGGSILALSMAFMIGAGVSVVIIYLKKKGLKEHIPFGPFLVLGSLLAMIFGEQIVNLYLSLAMF